MKKILMMLLCVVLMVSLMSGCNSKSSSNSETGKQTISGSSEPSKPANKNSENDKKVDADSSKAGKSKVFKPDELLSQEEAAEIIGLPVTLDTSTLGIDSETGVSQTRYEYSVSESTDMSALFYLQQNDAVPDGSDESAENSLNSEISLFGKDYEPIPGLGDKAYLHKMQQQVFVLYGDYYFIAAFGVDDKEKDKEINLKIAKKVIENIDKKK
jgi:uncharacterized protein YceK